MVTAVGFEPTPLQTGALTQRLRQLGQTVLSNPNNTIVSFGLDCSENGMGEEAGIEERLRNALQQRYLMEVPRRHNPELLVARPVGLITGSGAKGIWRNLQVSIAETQDACV